MKKALLVGVDRYEDVQIRDLKYAFRDARSLGWMFKKLGYDVKVLENPRQNEVCADVERLAAALDAGDQFLFYFSGHGFTIDGRHRLFCADDRYRNLRFGGAGIAFDYLVDVTKACGCDRVFLLDACRSDFLTGVRGGGNGVRTLGDINDMAPRDQDTSGAYYILRSCSQYEHAYEIDAKQHGLFTLALMKVLLRARTRGTRLLFDDALRREIAAQMRSVVRDLEQNITQSPESIGGGEFSQFLLDGCAASAVMPSSPVSPPVPQPPPPAPQGRPARFCAEPVDLFNAFALLLARDELRGFSERFQRLVPLDPAVRNPRKRNSPRVIENDDAFTRLLEEIRFAHLEGKRAGRDIFSEASRLELSLRLRDLPERNRFLEAIYECVELDYDGADTED